ncbi:MAG TPA: hypothetical protein VGC42_26440, partial [Kofleriaceae bacterium]
MTEIKHRACHAGGARIAVACARDGREGRGISSAPPDCMPAVRPRPLPPDMPGAEAYLPERLSLSAMRASVATCHGCPLYRDATQA